MRRSLLVVLGALVALALAVPGAHAASIVAYDGIHYTADPGEANDLVVAPVLGGSAVGEIDETVYCLTGLQIFPHCEGGILGLDDYDVARDGGAQIRMSAYYCIPFTRLHAVVCRDGQWVVALGDGDDRARVLTTHKNVLAGGAGDDDLDTLNGLGGDQVYCGLGDDTVTADAGDFVADNCEHRNFKRVPIP